MSAQRSFESIEGSPRIAVMRVQGSIDLEDSEKNLIDRLMGMVMQGYRHLLVDWTQLHEVKADAQRAIGATAPVFDGRFDRIAVLAPPRLAPIVSKVKNHVSKTDIQTFDDEAAAIAWLQGGDA